MPTILYLYGFYFRFYSNENDEPPHIHVFKGDATAKYWLIPTTSEVYSYGFSNSENKKIKNLVEQNKELFKLKWYEYFT